MQLGESAASGAPNAQRLARRRRQGQAPDVRLMTPINRGLSPSRCSRVEQVQIDELAHGLVAGRVRMYSVEAAERGIDGHGVVRGIYRSLQQRIEIDETVEVGLT